jgi:hypothetical protein
LTPQEEDVDVSDVIASLALIVTTIAVVTALFKEWFVSHVLPPKVRLRKDNFAALVDLGGQTTSHGYARLLLTARARRPAPDDLRVYLLTCHPPATIGGTPRRSFHLPLRWSFTHSDAETLQPGVPRYVDLALIKQEDRDQARLLTTPVPSEGYLLPAGETYDLDLAVAANNMDAHFWHVQLTVRGWDGRHDTLETALAMSEPREVTSLPWDDAPVLRQPRAATQLNPHGEGTMKDWPAAIVALGFLGLIGVMFWRATEGDFETVWTGVGSIVGVATGAIPSFFFRSDAQNAREAASQAHTRAELMAGAADPDKVKEVRESHPELFGR